jgi:hypothetical protein
VAYKLDLLGEDGSQPGANKGPSEKANGPLGLVILDPRMDLPGARREADTIRQRLSRWRLTTLNGTQTSASRFRQEVVKADLLHYSGHGEHQGLGGWQSALLLARQDTFEVGDILALSSVPKTVVLLGCETAMTQKNQREWGIGLAHAFLVAGSEEVVAASRKLNDAVSHGFSNSQLQVFYLTYVKENSLEEVCEKLNLKTDTVYSWRSRIMKKARSIMEELAADSDGHRSRRAGTGA